MHDSDFNCLINMPIYYGQGLYDKVPSFVAEIVAISLKKEGWRIHLMKSFGLHSVGGSYSASEVFDWTPWISEGGSYSPSPGHFRINCRQLSCEWIVPLVERMAGGAEVQPEEVLEGFRERYDHEPITDWKEMDTIWRKLSLECPRAQQFGENYLLDALRAAQEKRLENPLPRRESVMDP